MQRTLIIMRGVPGSGKSSISSKLKTIYQAIGRNCIILSTDEFFIVDGIYKFDPKKLERHHKENVEKAVSCFREGVEVVIIDNTNIRCWHYSPYISYGTSFGYKCYQCVCVCIYENIHNVPFDKIKQLGFQFEEDHSIPHLIMPSQLT